MKLPMANYTKESGTFSRLAQPECEKKILFIRGKTGYGKTMLINKCLADFPDEFNKVSIQLSGTAPDIDGFLERLIRSVVGVKSLPLPQKKPETVVNHINLQNIQQKEGRIDVLLDSTVNQSNTQRQADLIDHWFCEIDSLGHKVILCIDDYDQGMEPVKDWIKSSLLHRIVTCNNIRIVLAGQEIPDPDGVGWHSSSDYHLLSGVEDPKHWLPLIKSKKPESHDDTAIGLLAGACKLFEGNPSDIMQFIELSS